MGRSKKSLKAKEPIKLRSRLLANGNYSLYLDKYKNGVREYEYLKMYLVPEVDDASRIQNANTLQAANAIKAQRILEVTNDEAGIKNKNQLGKMPLIDWLVLESKRKTKYGNSTKRGGSFDSTIAHLKKYIGDKVIKLCDVDKPFILGFIDYLSTAKWVTKNKAATISRMTAKHYYNVLGVAMNDAVKSGMIPFNPMSKVSLEEKKLIKPDSKSREYLTIEEVKKMQTVECTNNDALRSFMFSCFTGLRYSDIKALTWGDIQDVEGHKEVVATMIKTKRVVRVPLSDLALQWLPEKPDDAVGETIVFDMPNSEAMNKRLKKFAKRVGINKHITFHTARHTFATMGLTSGADIYTISKLLGHTKITTTQIYAEIINQKKVDAVNLIGDNFKD